MAVGDRFKKFDLERLRTYEKYDDEGTLKVSAHSLIPNAVKNINDSVEEKLKTAVMEKVENIPVWFDYDYSKQKELIERLFDTSLKETFGLEDITDAEREILIEKITNHVSGFGILQTFLEQKNVDSVIVNSTKSVLIQIGGKILDTEMVLDENQLNFLLRSINSKSGEQLSSPISSINFENYSITVISKPIASNGVIVKIKKMRQVFGLNDLILSKFLTKEVADFILTLIQSREKIIISGELLSGKTCLVDNMLSSLLHSFRVGILEDYPQLSTNYARHVKFNLPSTCENGSVENLLSIVFSLLPDYVVFDSKSLSMTSAFIENLADNIPAIITVPASSPESALNKLICSQVSYSNIPEKLSKQKILNTFHYVIQLDKDQQGNCRIKTINEINLTRNSAQVLKELYNVNSSLNLDEEDINDVKSASVKSRFHFD